MQRWLPIALLLVLPPAALAEASLDGGEDDLDSPGFEEDLEEGARELEELLRAEAETIDVLLHPDASVRRLGAAHPLRRRAFDLRHRHGDLPHSWAPLPEGDAGAILEELDGIDLAALKARYDIPIEINEQVVAYVRFFQGRGRKWFTRWLERSHRWIPFMQPILAEEGVPLDLVYLAMIESGFSAHALSSAKASGFWQFMGPTGKRFGLRDDFWVDERRDPVLATRAGARYLKKLHEEFDDWYLAWAGYNAGEGKMRRAIRMYGTRDFWELSAAGRYLRPETKHYVPKLMAAAIIAKHPERFGFEGVAPEGPFEFEEVEVPDATDLEVIARAAGVDADTIRHLNPSLRRWCTPPARGGKGYKVKIPPGTKERFLAEYASVKPTERLTFRHHRVQRGDTLSVIARQFDMPVEAIMKMNNIRNPRMLRVGMDLIIPLPADLATRHPDRATAAVQTKAKPQARQAPRATTARIERAPVRSEGQTRYVVRKGDTLWSISQRFGVEVESLRRWNNLGRGGHRNLRVGQSLVVSPPRSG